MQVLKNASIVVGALMLTQVGSSSADTPKAPGGPAAAAGAPAAPDSKEPIMLLPDDVKWTDAPAVLPPGAKISIIQGDITKDGYFAFRMKFPDGYKIPPHVHPKDENVTILKGTFYLGMGDKLDTKTAKGLSAGSYFSMPQGHHHFAYIKGGEVILQVTSIGPWGLTYLNPADDPRNAKK